MSRASRAVHVCAVVVLTAALYGCGGGSLDADPVPPPPLLELTLPSGNHALVPTGDDPITVAAGASGNHGNVVISCPADGEDCVVHVAENGSATYSGVGGKPTVAPQLRDLTLPSGNHALVPTGDDPITVAAGASGNHGNVVISCPADGEDCVVHVAENGSATYSGVGGEPTFAPQLRDLTLPSGNHALVPTGDDPITVAAGASGNHGNVVISCPADGEDCVVHVAENGSATYSGVGGEPTFAPQLRDLTLPSGNHALVPTGDDPITVAAGASGNHGNVVISCPPDGEECVIYVAENGSATYSGVGGEPTFASQLRDLTLPDGHDLMSTTIPAGATESGEYVNGRTVGLTCPAGGEDCVVAVAEDGSATYEATGGMPIDATETNEMIWAANSNSGPGSGHAPALHRRMRSTATKLYEEPAVVVTSVVQSSVTDEPDVVVDATYAFNSDPVFEMTLGRPGVGLFGKTLEDAVEISDTIVSAIPDLGADWNHAALTEDIDGGTTVHVAVYSDIEREAAPVAAVNETFGNLDFSGDQEVGQQLNMAADRIVEDLRIPVMGLENVVVTVRRDWDEAVTPGTAGLSVTFDSYDHDGDPSTPTLTDGILQCVAAPCESQQQGDNQVRLLGTWQVVVEVESAIPAMPDEEYLTLGVWLSLPDRDDGRFDVGAFADGAKPFQRADIDTLTGTAEYTGPATGVYAANEGTETWVGSFDATATLEANFGPTGPTVPVVDGFVRDFMENGQSLGDWIVELDDTTGAATGNDTLFIGNTSGEADGRRLTGRWGVRFFENGDEPDPVDHPGYAAGTFTSSTEEEAEGTLEIIGAFGATKQ